MPTTHSTRLAELLRERALRFGDFTLTSGQKSRFYLDGKQVTLDAEGSRLVAEAIIERIRSDWPDAIGGMSLGADPIVGAVLALAGSQGLPLKGFLVRKQPKGHGTQQAVEGPLKPGSRVVVVEDVMTTGNSTLEVIQRVEELGCHVVQVIGVVDRLQGAGELFRKHGYRFTPLLTIADLGIERDDSA